MPALRADPEMRDFEQRGAFDCRHPTRRGDTPRLLNHRESHRTSIFIAIIRRTSFK
jgi:hypothetical protein